MGNVFSFIAYIFVSDKYEGTCERPWTCQKENPNDDNDCRKHYNEKYRTVLCKTEHDNTCTDNRKVCWVTRLWECFFVIGLIFLVLAFVAKSAAAGYVSTSGTVTNVSCSTEVCQDGSQDEDTQGDMETAAGSTMDTQKSCTTCLLDLQYVVQGTTYTQSGVKSSQTYAKGSSIEIFYKKSDPTAKVKLINPKVWDHAGFLVAGIMGGLLFCCALCTKGRVLPFRKNPPGCCSRMFWHTAIAA